MNREHDRKLEHEVFEKYGEHTVRHLLREGRIINQRAVAAQAWLDEQEESRRVAARRQAEAAQTEQLELARAAASARRRATIALVVSAIAVFVAVVGAWAASSDAARPALASHAAPMSR